LVGWRVALMVVAMVDKKDFELVGWRVALMVVAMVDKKEL
jgi:hypothetical protein